MVRQEFHGEDVIQLFETMQFDALVVVNVRPLFLSHREHIVGVKPLDVVHRFLHIYFAKQLFRDPIERRDVTSTPTD